MAWLPDSLKDKATRRACIECVYTSEVFIFRYVDKKSKVIDKKQFDVDAVLAEKANLQEWLSHYSKVEIILEVPEEVILSKRVNLPRQARENLSSIMHYEIDRQTPFESEQVYSSYIVEDSTSNETTLSVLLSVVPIQALKPGLELLQQLEISPSKLLLRTQKGQVSYIRLPENTAQEKKGFTLNYGLASVAIILFLLVLYKPIFYYAALSQSILSELDAAKKKATQVSVLKHENESMLQRLQFLDNKLAEYLHRIIVLNELAMILPSHTWLESVEIEDGIIIMQGESSEPSGLISLLTERAHYEEVVFSAPTVHNDESGKEQFQIRAKLMVRRTDGLHEAR